MALLVALASLTAAAATAQAGGGGVSAGPTCPGSEFGTRTLELGDCGRDVHTLNWILRSERYPTSLAEEFDEVTDTSVRAFQQASDLRADGIVGDDDATALRRSLRRDPASWYGPGFYGNRTACGQRLRRTTVGVAHRRLPCGTRVVIGYHGRWVRTRVIDRGPYAKRERYHVDWDLTGATAQRLGLAGNDRVRVGVIR